jgi:hypothetical protein
MSYRNLVVSWGWRWKGSNFPYILLSGVPALTLKLEARLSVLPPRSQAPPHVLLY